MAGILIPRVTKLFNVYFGDAQESFAGKLKTAKIPDVSEQLEEHRGSGMFMPRNLKQGLENMEASLVLTDYNPNIHAEVARVNGSRSLITIRGSIDNDETEAATGAQPIKIVMRANAAKLEANDLEEGSLTEHTLTLNTVKYFAHYIDGVEKQLVDSDNIIWRVNGVDRMATHRANIGL
jgi:P2 family phage contractile tail tube protein